MRLKKPIIAVSTVALMALAACGGSGDPTGTGGTGGTDGNGVGEETSAGPQGAAGAGKDPTAQAPAPEIEGAQEGGTVTVISASGLNSMDPSEAYYTNTAAILQNLVVRSLTQYVRDDATGDMVLVPDLATDLGTPNKDFTEWEFTIRDGVKFENGQEVTAKDVAFGIMRSFDRASFPEGAAYSNDYFLDGDTYKGPYKSGTDYKGIEVDGMTLTLKMSAPFPDMPYWGAFPAISPIPEGDVSNPADYALHPWATGPYMFDKYTPEKALTLVKNPHWDADTDPGRHQYVDKWDMSFDDDSAKIDAIMLADEGEGQTTFTYDNIQAANFLEAKEEAADRLTIGTDPCTFMWYPDYREITEIEVRQALAYAYPYEAALEASGAIIGVTNSYGTNIMPPGIPGREEFNPLPDHEIGTTDPEKAKELLKEAGYAPGEYEISFLAITDDPTYVAATEQIVKGLEEAGFVPKPFATTIADYSTLRSDPATKVNVRSGGWCSDWPSGGSWFPPVFETTNLEEEGLGANYAAFSEPEFDKEIDRILQLDLTEQPAEWNKLDMKLQEEWFPVFVTAYGGVAMMRGSKIGGFEVDPTFGLPTMKNMFISE